MARNPYLTNYKLTNFYFFGKPEWVFPLLAALFLWFLLLSPIMPFPFLFAFALASLFPLVALYGIIGLFLKQQYRLAAVSLVLLFAILLSGVPLARFYENMRLKILRPQMQSTAEELFSQ